MKNMFVKTNKKNLKRTTAVGFLATISLLVLPACSGPQTETTAKEEANVTAGELVEDTADYVGQQVTIRNVVEATVDDTSFLMVDDDYFDGDGILVINTSSEPFLIPDVGDSQVQVTGKVGTFSTTTAADDYNLTLSPELYGEYEAKPVIFAESIALSPDPGDITANPETYYNQQIAVQGEVEDILDSGLFTLDEDKLFSSEDLLVIPQEGTQTVQAGDVVAITGVLRPYIKADFEKDYDLQWDLTVEESIEAEYEQKPVFVADGVFPSALP